jgi:hypothetical protein
LKATNDKAGKRAKLMRGRRRGKIWTQRDRFGNHIYLTYKLGERVVSTAQRKDRVIHHKD